MAGYNDLCVALVHVSKFNQALRKHLACLNHYVVIPFTSAAFSTFQTLKLHQFVADILKHGLPPLKEHRL